MQTLDLGGDWTLTKAGSGEEIPAEVPGCVQTDLLAAGRIEDPFHRDRELDLQWIGESDWLYRRTFTVPASMLESARVLLRCEGLDTFAAIKINGTAVGATDNMFRTWEFDVRRLLREGENEIRVLLSSTYPFMKRKQAERFLTHTGIGHHRVEGSNRVRKSQCHYGWDWGPILVPAGIWRPIRLIAWDRGRITELSVAQRHRTGRVDLEVGLATERQGRSELSAEVTVSLDG